MIADGLRARAARYAAPTLVLASFVIARPVLGPFQEQIAMTVAVMAIATTGISILVGPVRRDGHPLLISFGHSAFMAIGAYGSIVAQTRWELPFLAAVAVAIAASSLVAFLVALAGSRMGVFGLGLVTFSLAFVAEVVARGNLLKDYTNGHSGLSAPRADVFGIDVSRGAGLYYLVVLALVGGVIVHGNLGRSRLGHALRMMQQNEEAAAAFGVRRTRAKVLTFCVSGAYGSIAGVLLALVIGFVSPDSVASSRSVELFAMLIVGGAGTVLGPLAGAIFFVVLPQLAAFLDRDAPIFFSGSLLIVLVLAPNGIVGTAASLWERATAFRRRVQDAADEADDDDDVLERALVSNGPTT